VLLAKPQESKNPNEVDLKGNTGRFEWVKKPRIPVKHSKLIKITREKNTIPAAFQ